MRYALAMVACLALSACADIPRDPERTTSLVSESGTIRLGIATDVPRDEEFAQILGRVSAATGARPQAVSGDTEALLRDLKDGRIDLVYGVFADDSPWAREVHFSKAPGWRAQPPKATEVPRFAMRNGENGWIMLVERAIAP